MDHRTPEPFPSLANSATRLASKYALNSKNVVSSAYWKVPDAKSHLTSVACHDEDPLVAVASGSRDSNLFIYEANAPQDDRYIPNTNDGYHIYPTSLGNDEEGHYSTSRLGRSGGHKRSVSEGTGLTAAKKFEKHASPVLTHHQTISLGGIHSMAWVSSRNKLGSHGNILATGHNSGLVHLVLLPDPYANNGPAEIVHRFNHARHLSSDKVVSSRIRTLNLTTPEWTCCSGTCLMSLFSEHIFMWDPNRADKPMVVQRARRTRSFNLSPLRNGIVSLATDRGVSIMDIRYKSPVILAPPNSNEGLVSLAKWSSLDENRLASVHDQTTIKVWDIRTGSPLVTLDGHYDKINAIEWSKASANEFYSASSDGTIRIWDINKYTDAQSSTSNTNTSSSPSSSSEETPAVRLRRHRRACSEADTSLEWLPSQKWRLYRQRLARENSIPSYNYFLDNQNPQSPCTTIFSNNKEFIGLSNVNMPVHSGVGAHTKPHLVSIDNNGFFGIHTKIAPEALLPADTSNVQEELEMEINSLCQSPIAKDAGKLRSRTSQDSLASKSSSSAGGESPSLDAEMEDSRSETSSSASSSAPASPRSNPRRDSAEDERSVHIFREHSPTSRHHHVAAAVGKTRPLLVNKKLPELPFSLDSLRLDIMNDGAENCPV